MRLKLEIPKQEPKLSLDIELSDDTAKDAARKIGDLAALVASKLRIGVKHEEQGKREDKE